MINPNFSSNNSPGFFSSINRKSFITFMIVGLVGFFYFSTIRDGHNWGGDFAQYINHAKNLAEGIDYAHTSFISNPEQPRGPKAVPPVFPIILAPVYWLFGMNLTAMKIIVISSFLVSLLAIFLCFKNELSFGHLSAVILIIGFNPYFWDFKDNILADIPFMMFFYLSLLLIHQCFKQKTEPTPRLTNLLVAGLIIYLAYNTKYTGIVLIPCLVIYDLINFRKLTRISLIITLIFVSLVLLQSLFLQAERDYVYGFIKFFNLKTSLFNLLNTPKAISIIWDNGYAVDAYRMLFQKDVSLSIISYIFLFVFITLLGISLALSLLGYFSRIRNGFSCFEIVLPLCVGLYIIIPVPITYRYMIPLIPLYVFYIFAGIQAMDSVFKKKLEKSVLIALILLISVTYVTKYIKIDWGPIKNGICRKESRELFAYIKNNTARDDIIIFFKPKVLALLTGRKTARDFDAKGDRERLNYMYEVGASYYISRQLIRRNGLSVKIQLDSNFLRKYEEHFSEVFSNNDFKMYRIKSLNYRISK